MGSRRIQTQLINISYPINMDKFFLTMLTVKIQPWRLVFKKTDFFSINITKYIRKSRNLMYKRVVYFTNLFSKGDLFKKGDQFKRVVISRAYGIFSPVNDLSWPRFLTAALLLLTIPLIIMTFWSTFLFHLHLYSHYLPHLVGAPTS